MKALHFILIGILLTAMSLTVGAQCTNCSGETITGRNASGLGTSPTATGSSSLAGGYESTSRGQNSFAFGNHAFTSSMGIAAFALGFEVESNAPSSFTMGRFLKANTSAAFIIGSGSGSSGYLVNSVGSSLMVGFNSQYPTFFVSNSNGSTSTGKIGIGNITNPSSKLHLLADENEAAEINLEHRSTGNRQYAQVLLGTHSIRAGNAENMVFTTPKGRNFAFANGRVGINTTAPTQALDVDGNIRLRNNAAIGTWSNHSLSFNTNSAVRMVILGDGKVGFGISDPSQKIDIDGNIRLRDNATIGTWSNHSLSFNTNSTARMVIAANGNVGLGSGTDPQASLHITANGSQDVGILLEASGTGKSAGIFFTKSAVNIGTLDKDQPIAFYTAGTDLKMIIDPEGNVGIGVASPQHKLHVAGGAKFSNQVIIDAGGLYVNGEIKAKKYLATLTPFPDFVFLPDYKLLTLNEVESFITENGHLPGVPSAATIEKNGIELGEMNAMLLQKIEELTLYIIAQDKKIQALDTVVNTPK